MGLFTVILFVVLALSVIGLGWKTFVGSVIDGGNVLMEKGGPALKQLTTEAKEYVQNSSEDVVEQTIQEVLNK